jgi:hypothetical protein
MREGKIVLTIKLQDERARFDRSRGHDFRPAKTCRVARRDDPVPLRGIDLAGPDLARQRAGANRRGPLKPHPRSTS